MQKLKLSISLEHAEVTFLTIKEVMAPLASDLIILDRLLWSLRHHKHPNLAIISHDLNSWEKSEK